MGSWALLATLFLIISVLDLAASSAVNISAPSSAAPGENVEIRCVLNRPGSYNVGEVDFQNKPIFTMSTHVKTLKPSVPVKWRQKISVLPYDSRSFGFNFSMSAEFLGSYVCKFFMTDGGPGERSSEHQLSLKPSLKLSLPETDGVEGTEVEVSCKATLDVFPQSTLSVVKSGGSELKSISKRQTSSSHKKVYTFTAVAEDNGQTITCRAENGGETIGEVSKSVKVLYSARQVQIEPRSSTFAFNAVINCTAKGNPEPTIRWVKVAGPSDLIVDGSRLVVNSVPGSYSYKCVANNNIISMGKSSTESTSDISFTVTDGPTTTKEKSGHGIGLTSTQMIILISTGVGAIVLLTIIVVVAVVLCRRGKYEAV